MAKAHESLPPDSPPPEAWPPLTRLVSRASRPLQRFFEIEAASGVVLLVVAAIALFWANSPWRDTYAALWHTPIGIRFGAFSFERSLEWVVNDGLMVIFFFVVGLEIRREIHQGELSEWRRAALPAAAAVGGMLAPAGLYLMLAGQPQTHSGWGVPMATDIAFAVGILALLGRRVPPALRVLLLALAVIDDLGAIVAIALFYSSGVQLSGLALAAAGFAGIFVLRWLGVRTKAVYIAPGLVVWAGVYAAGIHPTIAGVAIGLVTPVQAWLGRAGFMERMRQKLDWLGERNEAETTSHELSEALTDVARVRREALSPAESLIELLHRWVAFFIMPVFALANAGVTLDSVSLDAAGTHVVNGVSVGLVVGKPVGILCASWLVLRLGVATLPTGIGARHLVVLGFVAGIGFTMALFIAQLAFSDPALLAAAKLAVLGASGVAAVAGLALGRALLRVQHVPGAAHTVEEAERSTEC